MATPVIDSSYPKKVITFPGNDLIVAYDSARDRFGNFYICGGLRTTGDTYTKPYVWKFDKNLNYIKTYAITGSIFNFASYHHLVSGIAIRSDGSIHIVGTYHNGIERHVFYSYLQDNDTFIEPIQVDVGNPSGEQTNSYNLNLTKIHVSSGDHLAVVWTGRGWDTRAVVPNSCVRIKKNDDTWTSVEHYQADGAGFSSGHIHLCASRDQNEFYFFCADNSSSIRSYEKFKVTISAGSILFTKLKRESLAYYNGDAGINLLMDDPNGDTYILWNEWISDELKVTKDISTTSLPGSSAHNATERGLSFNDNYLLFGYYDKDDAKLRVTRKLLSSGIGSNWEGPTDVLSTDLPILFSPTRTWPVISSKRIMIPSSGFMFWTRFTGDLIGDGETNPGLYVWAFDNLTWPSPDSESSPGFKFGYKRLGDFEFGYNIGNIYYFGTRTDV